MPLHAILGVEPLPVELTPPGAGLAPGGGDQSAQLGPILLAALLVTLPLALWFALGRRQQRRHKTHRPRNPTLAEHGGLPPSRSPKPPSAA